VTAEAIPVSQLSSFDHLLIKIYLQKNENPLILRIYFRDKEAAYREQIFGTILKQTVPLPRTHFIGASMEGIASLLQNLFLALHFEIFCLGIGKTHNCCRGKVCLEFYPKNVISF